MHRFYLPPEASDPAYPQLRASDAHHAKYVLRLRVGDPVAILDGAGREQTCVVEQVTRSEVALRVTATRVSPPPPSRITVYQSVTKPKSMDFVMQKATELGAHRIVAVLTERSIPSFGGDGAERKMERWRDLAVEALKQCGTPWLPKIEEPVRLAVALERREPDELEFVGSLQSARRHPREHLDRFRTEHGRSPITVSVWVGPEGDFTQAELVAIESAGIRPITLGPLVLRAETATIYCLSFLNYELLAPPIAGTQANNTH